MKNQSEGGFTVLSNAAGLKEGTLNPEVLRFSVWKASDGKLWTLDHRRLGAFRLAGAESAPVRIVPQQQMWKMTTKTDGRSIILKLENGKRFVID